MLLMKLNSYCLFTLLFLVVFVPRDANRAAHVLAYSTSLSSFVKVGCLPIYKRIVVLFVLNIYIYRPAINSTSRVYTIFALLNFNCIWNWNCHHVLSTHGQLKLLSPAQHTGKIPPHHPLHAIALGKPDFSKISPKFTKDDVDHFVH